MHETRRHDLDWLRVGAFLLLILYHIGMFYVPWGWHVKSTHAPVVTLELPMKLSNGWRLPLLFFISGVALRFALDKTTPAALLRRRIWLLLVPLLFGMYVICAPQAWHELVQKGGWNGTVGEFYNVYASWPWASPEGWPIITPTWNHLWYVLYVLVYTCAIVLLVSLGRGRFESWLAPFGAGTAALAMAPLIQIVLMLVLNRYVGAAQTLYGDWYNLLVSFLIMSFGYVVGKEEQFWNRLRAIRYWTFALAIVLSILVSIIHTIEVPYRIDIGVRILQGWSVIWALLGWGQAVLPRPSPLLKYLSGAVFTYYILHQTIIIMVGVPLTAIGLPIGVEIGVLTAATALLCWTGYEYIARRMGRLGILLGARN